MAAGRLRSGSSLGSCFVVALRTAKNSSSAQLPAVSFLRYLFVFLAVYQNVFAFDKYLFSFGSIVLAVLGSSIDAQHTALKIHMLTQPSSYSISSRSDFPTESEVRVNRIGRIAQAYVWVRGGHVWFNCFCILFTRVAACRVYYNTWTARGHNYFFIYLSFFVRFSVVFKLFTVFWRQMEKQQINK